MLTDLVEVRGLFGRMFERICGPDALGSMGAAAAALVALLRVGPDGAGASVAEAADVDCGMLAIHVELP